MVPGQVGCLDRLRDWGYTAHSGKISTMPHTALIKAAQRIVSDSNRISFLTGAGISTDSGIPDFRGPSGLWTKDPDAEKLSDIRYYMSSRAIRTKAWIQRLHQFEQERLPNAGHLAIAQFESTGRVHALVTQNVDGLHQRAGSNPERLIEVHGTILNVRCLGCGRVSPMAETLERVRQGEDDPSCKLCGDILKSDTISFGQSLRPDTIQRAMDAASDCDCLIAVGTSLSVYPIANMIPVAVEAGAKLMIINNQATPMDAFADLIMRQPISEALPQILNM